MGKDNFLTKVGKALVNLGEEKPAIKQSRVRTERVHTASSVENYWFSISYDGEKNLGEVGPIKDYVLNYEALRARSWQAQLESKLAQLAMRRYVTWVVGKGLKLQSEPVEAVLKAAGINITKQEFAEAVEARFNLFKTTKLGDYSGLRSLDKIAKRAFKTAIIGGDVLVVLRYIDKKVKVQLIDGAHVKSPNYGTEWFPQDLPNGNRIINGIEVAPNGDHIRYFIKESTGKYTPIEAKLPGTNLRSAFLVYGSEHRLDNNRGVPLIVAMIETLKKLERYEEATVSSAEERAKLVFYIKHSRDSDGSNAFEGQLAKAFDTSGETEDLAEDITGRPLNNLMIPSTNKSAVNMPIGSELASLDTKNDLYFKEFFETNINIYCACLEAPPEVMLQKYDSNYSASRAALKDWEMTLGVKRGDFSEEFYQPVYDFCLHMDILEMRVAAPGYVKAINSGDDMVLAAYRNARFIGPAVPHIDPVKEVTAQRLKLGTLGQHLPLTTLASATEELSSGESLENIDQFAKELTSSESKGLKAVPVNSNAPPSAPGT